MYLFSHIYKEDYASQINQTNAIATLVRQLAKFIQQ